MQRFLGESSNLFSDFFKELVDVSKFQHRGCLQGIGKAGGGVRADNQCLEFFLKLRGVVELQAVNRRQHAEYWKIRVYDIRD